MRQDFLDFEILIAPGTGRIYPVHVVKSPAGRVKGEMHFPFDEAGLGTALSGLDAAIVQSQLVRSSGAVAGVVRGVAMEEQETPHTTTVKQFGTALYESLFSGDVATAFRDSKFQARTEKKGLRVRLRVDAAELSSLPWEFLYDPQSGDFVCLQSDTPLVRFLQIDRPMPVLRVTPPIRILAMVSSPRGHAKLDVQQERRRIEQATEGMRAAGLLEIVWMPEATVDALQKALRTGEYHVFHYVGHGGFDAALGKGVLIFSTESGDAHVLDAAMLARILAREDTLRLVVLNSCLGAKGSATDLFSSTAATLVRGGVPSVVGMQYEISDVAAIRFARTLYDSLGDGLPIDAAVAEARVTLSTDGGSVEWGTPVLHMLAPDGVLFEINGTRTSEARLSGAYKTIPRPQPVATTETVPAPAPVVPLPAPPVVPTPVVTTAPPPAPPPARPAGGGGAWKKIAIGASALVVLFVAFISWAIKNGGDTAVADSSEAAAADSTALPDSTAETAATEEQWIVQFQRTAGPDYTWTRIDSSCTWMEQFIENADTTYTEFDQVPSEHGEVELVKRDGTAKLWIPPEGGRITVKTDGKEKFVFAVVVRPIPGPAPAQRPTCDSSPAP